MGVARGITYGLFGPPEQIVEPARVLGAGLLRVYFFWDQVEPAPGKFDWSVVDSLLAQLGEDMELWVTVCSSSLWATRTPTDFLPPSPAKDPEQYQRFVHALVRHCASRVQYWQCDNEPSNTDLLWAGTAEEYAAQLAVFSRAVRDAHGGAAVVLGGCGYDVWSSPADGAPRQFFDHVLHDARDCFDLFSVHLYDDPRCIGRHITTAREMMRKHGYEKPIVVGEYNGPTLFEFPELEAVMRQTMMSAFAGTDASNLSTAELAASAVTETPERRAMKLLYSSMNELPQQLQMFLVGCSPELEEKRERISCREMITRNLFALAEGVERTVCWHLAPEVGNYEDPFTMMQLMNGKLPLLRYRDGRLGERRPAADTFERLARELDGAESVRRVELDAHPDVFAFVVDRADRQPLAVLWKDGDVFSGEDESPVVVEWEGTPIEVSVTPVAFLS